MSLEQPAAGPGTATRGSRRDPLAPSPPVRVLLVGLGAIGGMAAAECLASPAFEVVGAVDPLRAGERLGSVDVAASLDPGAHQPDVAMLCTASTLSRVEADLEDLAGAGVDVVSTCEQLTLPWFTDPVIAGRIDEAARAAGTTILGCGVNPGLVMDVLPVMCASASMRRTAVTVRRSVDLGRRRPQLRDKLGVGLPAADWQRLQEHEGAPFGHFGLVESARLLAVGLDWPITSSTFRRDAVVADGVVSGVEEVAHLQTSDGCRIDVQLRFEMGATDVDEITVDGDPPITVVAQGGIQGDKATVARLLAAARVVGAMPAGLRLPIEAPLWSAGA